MLVAEKILKDTHNKKHGKEKLNRVWEITGIFYKKQLDAKDAKGKKEVVIDEIIDEIRELDKILNQRKEEKKIGEISDQKTNKGLKSFIERE